MSEKAGHPVGQPMGQSVPRVTDDAKQPGTLKQLARKVLNSSVPLSQTVTPGTVGQPLYQRDSERDTCGTDELLESMKRLEAVGVCIAIFEDGDMRVVVTQSETVSAIDAGGTIYSPADMYHYVQLDEHERRMLHSFKRRFGGSTEWRTAKEGNNK